MTRYIDMKKIILRILSAGVIAAMLSASISASALEFVANDDDSVSISGNTGASLKRNAVTAYITNTDDASVYVISGAAEADGSFEFNWKPSKSGEHKIDVRAGALSFSETYWYSSVKEYNELMNKLMTGNKSTVESVLSDGDSLNAVGINPDDIADCDAECLANALCKIRDYTNGAENVLGLIPDAKLLAAYYAAASEQTLQGAAEALEKIGITLSDYAFYSDISDADLKLYIAKQFVNVLSEDIAGADTAFTDCIVLSAVEKCSSWAALDDYLRLLDYDGYNDSKYKDNAAKAVAGEKVKSRAALIEMLDAAITKAKKNAEQSSSSGGGGSSSSSERPVSVPAPIVKDEAVEETGERVVFSDVTESHWAFEAINYLRWEGIVNGSDFNCYYPENTVTRAEMTAMLVRAYGIASGVSSFADVEQSAWYYSPISAAFSAGLVSGDGDTFRPNDNVTRQDMAVMIYRFSANAGVQYGSGELGFADNSDIAEYAKEAVAAMSSAGIINGIDGQNFAPLANATRAQAAQLIYSAIKR